ncbi:LPS-assembly protein LptD [Cognatishimia maritima]|uniref:LPS-assembly protein LptD n=1 Tax=Cognatishimia maritima TaxID=870908 RepID=A0A1M5ITE4_9RHOB|nr:LPS assembly protein LptD [Cognatishimia maritima]SHG31594.1 LPS-assembly protein [Cognatishimia maritima]
MTRRLFNPIIAAVLLCAGLLTALPTHAQSTQGNKVILIADSVFLRGSETLIARGNVEASYGETMLTATSITYQSGPDQITIEGPIKITAPDGVQIFASFAELDADLQTGLIESARLVLKEQVNFTADRLRRLEGRRSILTNAAATSCKTCDDGRPPLWQIRARQVIHDQDTKQLYFEGAQFRLMDVPIFYVPRLRLPDPTLNRATGFLIPNIRARSRLGTGVKVPYFIAFGDHRDLTLTPYIAANTRTLEFRYRQAFARGRLSFRGAISDDDISSQSTRAYVFGEGAFDLRNDYKLRFRIQQVSDDAYLADYGYSSADRLNSNITVSRVNRAENTQLMISNFESIRTGEDNQTIPSFITSARKQKRFVPAALGGEALWELEAHSHYRLSDLSTDVNGDGVVDGRDVSRVNADLSWRRNWLLTSGIELGTQASIALDAVETRQDSTITDTSYAEITPAAAVSLRYPWIKRAENGVTHMIEPVVQLGWSGGTLRGGTVPKIANDESTRSEFDEGNLLSLSRFASDDRRERGMALAWGVNWSRLGPDWTTFLTLGQVVRDTVQPDFSASSGLAAKSSDILVAAKFKNQAGLAFSARTLIDGVDGSNKAEARGGWNNDRLGLEASYIWLDADPDEERVADLSEWNLDGSYRMTRHWTGLANWRYDVASDATAEAGFGVEYRNECVKAKFEVSRRFTSSTTVQPATDYSFTVEILGFSTKTIDKSYTRECGQSAG